MTINQIIVDTILFALSAVLSWAIKVYLVPFLKEKNLEQIANTVVKAAQAIYGAGRGQQKFDYCVMQIEQKYKVSINSEILTNAIQSAWQTLNMQQIDTGIKQK